MGQAIGVPLSWDDGPQDRHAALAMDVAEHIADLQVHFREYLLYALDTDSDVSHEILPLAHIGT